MFSSEQLQLLYGYGCALTGDEQQAHDLLHDAIEKCLQRPPNAANTLLAYTRTIMRNLFIDGQRHQQRFTEVPFDETDSALEMDTKLLDEMLITRSELDRLWRLFDPIEQEILYLWAVEGHTTSQIARIVGKPRGTILARLHRLRKKVEGDNPGALSGIN